MTDERSIRCSRAVSLVAGLALLACSETAAPGGDGTGASSGTSSGGSTSGTAGGGASAGGSAGSVQAGGSGGFGGTGAGGMNSSGGTSAGAGTGVGAGGGGGGGVGVSGGAGASAGGDMGGASGSAGAGGAGGASGRAGAGGSSGTAGAAGGPSLPPITDYKSMGPFTTTVDRNQGPNQGYTIYRPQTLGENGFLHAPIVFGPGIGQAVTVHATMLTNFASHGFVVVGCPVLSGGPGDAGNRMTMLNGLNWIVSQNTASGSIYAGKIYENHAVSMGFSVGGTSAVEIGGHEAVATVVSIHGHRATAALHGPMLQTTGTEDTVGLPLQQATYDMSQVPTFLATLTGAPHAYIEMNGGGEERPAIVAWMRYWIYGDTGAARYFNGNACVLCVAPWENPQRKNWQ